VDWGGGGGRVRKGTTHGSLLKKGGACTPAFGEEAMVRYGEKPIENSGKPQTLGVVRWGEQEGKKKKINQWSRSEAGELQPCRQ